jgi:hypothetical protein
MMKLTLRLFDVFKAFCLLFVFLRAVELIRFNLYSEKKAPDGLGDFNIGWQIIQTVKYADGPVLTAKEETVLQGIIDKLIEIGRWYGMDMNV